MSPILRSRESNREERSREKGRGNQSGESVTLNRMDWKGLSGKMALEGSPEGSEERASQAEVTTRARVLGLKCAWGFQRLLSRPPCGAGKWIGDQQVRDMQGAVGHGEDVRTEGNDLSWLILEQPC